MSIEITGRQQVGAMDTPTLVRVVSGSSLSWSENALGNAQGTIVVGAPATFDQYVWIWSNGLESWVDVASVIDVDEVPGTVARAGSDGLIGTPGSGGTQLSGAVASAGQAITAHALGNVSGTVTLDASLYGGWTATLTGNTIFNFINVPAAGTMFQPSVVVTQDGTGGRTVTFEENGSTIFPQWSGSPLTAATAAAATTAFQFETQDGGVTWLGASAAPASSSLVLPLIDGADLGLKAISMDPTFGDTASKAAVAGVIDFCWIKANPGDTITGLWYKISTAMATGANCFWMAFDRTGAQLGDTSNLQTSGNLTSTGEKTQAFASTFTVPADGIVMAGLLVGSAGTLPAILGGQGQSAAYLLDGTKGYPVFKYGSGLQAAPASLTLNSTNCTVANTKYCVGLY
jgi:hypothetical protein